MNPSLLTTLVCICLYSTGHWIGGTVCLGLIFLGILSDNGYI